MNLLPKLLIDKINAHIKACLGLPEKEKKQWPPLRRAVCDVRPNASINDIPSVVKAIIKELSNAKKQIKALNAKVATLKRKVRK
jgi:hypothetical protein